MQEPKNEFPGELLDAYMLEVLGVPLAGSYLDLQRVPALLIRQKIIYLQGRSDYHEWEALKAKK